MKDSKLTEVSVDLGEATSVPGPRKWDLCEDCKSALLAKDWGVLDKAKFKGPRKRSAPKGKKEDKAQGRLGESAPTVP